MIKIQQEKQQLNSRFEQKIASSSVSLDCQQWSQVEMQKLFKEVQSWGVEEFKLNTNKQKSIIKHIYHIEFPNLLHLYLHKNMIETIEGLHRIHCPQLMTLYLSNNFLNSSLDLKKMNCPKLTCLSLENNYIHDLSPIASFHFSLQVFIVEGTSVSISQSYDHKYLYKLSSPLKDIRMIIPSAQDFSGEKIYKNIRDCLNYFKIFLSID